MKDFFTGKTIFKIQTKEKNTGLKLLQFDDFSQYKSIYEAPENTYTNLLEFVSEETKKEIIQDTKLKKTQYIVFKCLNSTNPPTYNYGKIYSDLYYWTEKDNISKIHLYYYYNPEPDDRNLEFDPQQNIIKTVNKRGNTIHFKP